MKPQISEGTQIQLTEDEIGLIAERMKAYLALLTRQLLA
jgi:hypothetical protein